MFSVHGYRTREQLHDGAQSLIFRAVRETGGLPVILKVLKDIQPAPEQIARFKHEYDIVKEIDLPGVVKVHELSHTANHWLFVQEDFGAEALARLDLAGRIGIGEFLSLACAIAVHVAAIHQRGIVHKDLNPSNIVLHRRSGVVKLIDFGISTRSSRETVAFDHPSRIEGTPNYLSPEQTGRINQPLDHRTDLYSLGCTLYELVTGRPPFESADLVELIHCHLARAPEAAHVLRPDVPPALSAILEKLMAKNAADRYQSAHGLQADLDRCRRQWQETARVEAFAPGADDVARQLSSQSRLYGREGETADLLSTFQRVADGATELLLISGHSGIGKSALVKELYRPVTRGRGLFATGKFDQFQRDVPYGAILSAVDGLIGHVLMEPPAQMAAWAAVIQNATGKMLPALVEILPRLELLLGRLPAVGAMSAAEARHRFIAALSGLIRVFASGAHPLVLFIDDLQWADGASLDLLKHLMSDALIPHLLCIGAYRDHEVGAAHPLRAALAQIRSSGLVVREVHLDPLDPEDTAALLADTLHRTNRDVRDTAAVIHAKTGGNPLFIRTFLDTLSARGVLFFDDETRCWQWQAERLRVLELSDNLVDLLIASLRELPAATRELLTVAACIGDHFELELLAAVAGRPANAVAAELTPALAANYLIPSTTDYRLLETGVEDLNARLDVSYKFAHDRIQQAAHHLSAPGAHAAIHLRIGRTMRAQYAGKSADSRLLAIVNQHNHARLLIDDITERVAIASLNLDAGRRARSAVANTSALEYFEHGLAFLGDAPGRDAPSIEPGARISSGVHEQAFRTSHPLAVALTEGAAEAAYLVADFATMDGHIDELLRQADRPMDRVKATQVRINAQVARMQLLDSISTAREILGHLGVSLPAEPSEADVDAQFELIAREMSGREPRHLVDLPDMKEAGPASALRILHSIAVPAFIVRPSLVALVAAQMVLLSLRHGLAEDSVGGFIFHGLALCAREHIQLGCEFGNLAEMLVEKHELKSQIPTLAGLGGGYVFHWQRPLRDAIQRMRDGYRAGLESGNIGTGVNCLQTSSAVGFWAGCDLSVIDSEYVESAKALEKHKQGIYLIYLRQYHQAVRNFRGLNEDPTRLEGDIFDEAVESPAYERANDMTAAFGAAFNRSMLCYHFHQYSESLRCARKIEKGNQSGSMQVPIAVLYQCLSLLATHSDAEPETRPAILEEAKALVLRMKRWGELCPVNYAHKYHLMAAELARVAGQPADARDHYDAAIERAHEHEYLNEEGLALERAALFFLEQDNPRLAGHYMRDAYYAYGVWGAAAKLDFLSRRYGYLLHANTTPARPAVRLPPHGRGAVTTHAPSTARELGNLDLATFVAATRAITQEADLGRVLHTIMRVSLENAGAERGFLVLARNEQLIVKVRGELGDEARFESLSLALQDQEGIARSVVQYVARTARPVLLDDAAGEGMFVNDPHIQQTACKSLLCVPILHQGSLVAVSYLENNRATSVFNEDRLTVLTLLMGQAAVSIENALLKESSEVRDLHFRAGGSLPADSPAYVRRKADEQLADNVRRGELSYVFNTRQMGKSSLRVRAVEKLGKAGAACVSIDLTSIGARDVTAEQWFAGVARVLVTGLGLQKDFDLRRWWREHAELSPVQRLDVLFDEVILTRIDKPIAVFVDEVDAVLGLPFSPDDFFALIRSFHNRRADDPRYLRLSFVLLGVATPADLISDKRRTPFNVGRAVPLAGFRFDEAQNLVPGLARAGDGEQLLRAVLDWSGGQPFLTQKLCRLVVEAESRPPVGKEREWVAALVHRQVIDKWRHQDEPEHLKTIEARILRTSSDPTAVLALYRRILEAGEIDAGDSPEETTLLLSGLVTRTFDKLRIGNPIYAAVFNDAWIQEALGARPVPATSAPS